MSIASHSTPSALPVARGELQAVRLDLGSRKYWTIKDPLTLRYYQFRDEEQFILSHLDGRHTAEQIVALFARRFAPRRLRPAELSSFVFLLYREGLVIPPAMGQGDSLLARRDKLRRGQTLSRWSNLLAIQLGGINPNRWLTRALPYLRGIFTPVFAGFVATIAAVAGLTLVVHFSTLSQRLPRFQEFFAAGNLLWLAVTLAIVKTLHELGHAIVCKRLGGDVTQMGIMLLVFTPVLYCRVDDAWMFTRKWQRIAVSAAGMAVELLLAAIATLLWAASDPGLLNSICLNVMFVCSVGTLLINGNPLLRYDGYYILSDLTGIANLRHQAAAVLDRLLVQVLTGIRIQPSPLLIPRHPVLLLSYAIASLGYRWLALASVLWLVYSVLQPYGLGIVAQVLSLMCVVSLGLGPGVRIHRFLSNPGQRSRIRPSRLVVAVLGCLALISILVSIPLPYHVTAPIVLRPQNARRVFAATSGVLESAVPAGTLVVAGQELGRLRNRALELELATLTARVDQQRLHLQHLKLRQHDVAALADEIPAANLTLADLDAQRLQKQIELQRLVLVAPQSGTVIPPRPRHATADAKELPGVEGTPLMPANLGCLIDSGSLFCLVGDPTRLEALALVDESSLPYLGPGQTARLSVAEYPGRVLTARVVAIAHLKEEDLPPELIESRSLALAAGTDRQPRPLQAVYEVILELSPSEAPLLLNACGWSHIDVPPQSLWERANRAFRSTFHWPW